MLEVLSKKHNNTIGKSGFVCISKILTEVVIVVIISLVFSSCNKNYSNFKDDSNSTIEETLANYSSSGLPQAKIVDINKVWDSAGHNAFTDLIAFKQKYYCVFREASSHNNRDGTIRVLRSKDLLSWESVQKIEISAHDLRDPKLSISPDNQLLISAAAAFLDSTTGNYTHDTYLWTSDNGTDWPKPQKISETGHWLWRFKWNYNKSTAFGFAYKTDSQGAKFLSLYKGNSSLDFSPLKKNIYDNGIVSESDIIFLGNDVAFTMVRRDGETNNNAVLGFAKPPYLSWKWKSTNLRAASPSLILLPENKIIAVVRLYDEYTRTSVCLINPIDAKITELLELESGGDTGYPGVLYVNDTLYVSYYSSHEGKAAVYLAKVKIDDSRKELDKHL